MHSSMSIPPTMVSRSGTPPVTTHGPRPGTSRTEAPYAERPPHRPHPWGKAARGPWPVAHPPHAHGHRDDEAGTGTQAQAGSAPEGTRGGARDRSWQASPAFPPACRHVGTARATSGSPGGGLLHPASPRPVWLRRVNVTAWNVLACSLRSFSLPPFLPTCLVMVAVVVAFRRRRPSAQSTPVAGGVRAGVGAPNPTQPVALALAPCLAPRARQCQCSMRSCASACVRA